MNRAALLACSALAGLGACSGATPAPPDSGISGDQACQDLAAAICNTYNGCSVYELMRNYGDVATCISQQKANCVLALGAPETSRTPATIETCAIAEQTDDCGDFFASIPAQGCAPTAGNLALGATCTSSFQCQSTFCQTPILGGVCGSCQPPSTAGQSCLVVDCSIGFLCGSDTHVCVPVAFDGGACTDSNECIAPLACFGFDGGNGGGLCVPEGALGTTCDGQNLTAAACNTRQGLSCINRVCVSVPLEDAGSTCGEIDAGPRPCPVDAGLSCILNEPISCQGNGDCVEANGAAVCVAAAPNGATCDVSVGPSCLPPAKCVLDAGTTGLCQLADPSLCAG